MDNTPQDNQSTTLLRATQAKNAVRLLPPQPKVLMVARQHASEENLRIGMLAKIVSEDPVIALEILKLANGMFYSAGRTTVSTVHAGVIRLGSDALIEIFAELSERPLPADAQVAHCLNMARFMCKRAGGVARILAAEINRSFIEEAEVGGLLVFFGQMLAVDLLGETYVRLAEANPHYKLLYRLSVDHNFDIEARGLSYLEKIGLPESLLFIWDREATPKKKEKALLRPICQAAGEIVTSFLNDGLEKLKPGKTLPSKSAIRLLPLSETDYARVFEQIDAFLEACEMEPAVEPESDPIKVTPEIEQPPSAELESSKPTALEEEAVQTTMETAAPPEIESFSHSPMLEPPLEQGVQFDSVARDQPGRLKAHRFKGKGPPERRDSTNPPPLDDLTTSESSVKDENFETSSLQAQELAPPVTEIETDFLDLGYIFYGQQIALGSIDLGEWQKGINKILEELSACQAILDAIKLTATSIPSPDFYDLFKRVIIFQPFESNKSLKVITSSGSGPEEGELVAVAPGNECFYQLAIKIQSMGAVPSPFGSRGYGLAPLKGPNHPTLGLYVDCGCNGSFSFAARRAFRVIAEAIGELI